MNKREELLMNLVVEHRESERRFVYFIVGLEFALSIIILLQRKEFPSNIQGYLPFFYALSFGAANFGVLSRLWYRLKLSEELRQYDPNTSKEKNSILFFVC